MLLNQNNKFINFKTCKIKFTNILLGFIPSTTCILTKQRILIPKHTTSVAMHFLKKLNLNQKGKKSLSKRLIRSNIKLINTRLKKPSNKITLANIESSIHLDSNNQEKIKTKNVFTKINSNSINISRAKYSTYIIFYKKAKNEKTMRSFRLVKGYPVNGQRTRSNGRTAKKINKLLFNV